MNTEQQRKLKTVAMFYVQAVKDKNDADMLGWFKMLNKLRDDGCTDKEVSEAITKAKQD